ncbi:MAG: hypothetical protein CM15mV41_1130 [Caudoviricetes sp.]|nr:MAG: hypothetical protein CM15mV41_1130 [Caudoviricetes sp.]
MIMLLVHQTILPVLTVLKISTQFVKRLITDEADKDFIELLRIKKSRVKIFC